MKNTLPFMSPERISSFHANTLIIRRAFYSIAVFFVAALLFTACKKEVKETVAQQEISEEVLAKVKRLGFGTGDIQKVADGYLVEGDILLTEEHLNSTPKHEILRIGDEEQYRTSNTVLGLPRVITIRVSTSLPSSIVAATDAAIARYNALRTTSTNFLLFFQRVTTGGTIVVNPAPSGSNFLASAGFPTNAGNPFNQILVNSPALTNFSSSAKTTVMAHEIGHCIGFRHTDWFNRSSCSSTVVNEGAGTVGAKHIPGTPTGVESGSWMLACLSSTTNRPFTTNDITALRWLY